MPSDAQENAAQISAISSSKAYFFEPKRAGQVAVETWSDAAGVAELMQRRAVPVDRLEIGLRRRHLHIVLRRHIEGAIAADAEVDAGRLDQRFDARLDHAGRRRRRDGRDLVGQILALIGVEDGEALEERDRLRVLAGFAPRASSRHRE